MPDNKKLIGDVADFTMKQLPQGAKTLIMVLEQGATGLDVHTFCNDENLLPAFAQILLEQLTARGLKPSDKELH
jgi:hypothetical protein